MASRGIAMVCFGNDFERLGAAVQNYSSKFTDLPWHIITNIKESAISPLWKTHTTFKFFERPQRHNRNAKLNLDTLSPFDETIYIDCDSVIKKPGIELCFDWFGKNDVVFNPHIYWKKEDRIVRIYIKTMKMFGVSPPIIIYNGGVFAFRKTDAVHNLFAMWRDYWTLTGQGREMPSLNCAIANSKICVSDLKEGFFACDNYNDKSVIQHDFGKNFTEMFNLPKWKDFKPFDSDPKDFKWEDWSWQP